LDTLQARSDWQDRGCRDAFVHFIQLIVLFALGIVQPLSPLHVIEDLNTFLRQKTISK